ncbi:hypothetical protein ACS0TY_014797 [Phlomoides rotata]
MVRAKSGGEDEKSGKLDYNLAALKLLCVQLKSATLAPSQNAFALGAILFQRAWLQGVLISVPSSDADADPFLLDDGTGVIQLNLNAEFLSRRWEAGMYVMVVGGYVVRPDDLPMIKKGSQCGILKSLKPSIYFTNLYLKYDGLGEKQDQLTCHL